MRLIEIESLDSTNEYLKRKWKSISEDVCVVRASRQTSGKGRLNRKWFSDEGGLWFSVLLRNPAMKPFYYQKSLSLSICSALDNLVKPGFMIKWPNDVYFEGRKICGILQENIFERTLKAVIIGAGVNVCNEIPEELKSKATSVLEISGTRIEISRMLSSIIEIFMKNIRKSEDDIDENWIDKSLLKIGQNVEVCSEEDGMGITGRIAEIPFESFKIITENGALKEYFAGDIRLAKF